MLKVATIIGSLRKESINKKLMHALDKLAHPDIDFQILKIDDIPLFNQDNENNLPPSVANFKNEVKNANAVLFVTPEYNRSIPGVLKNVIDWGTRPSGTNCWVNKPTAIIGTSQGSVATAVAQSHLRSIMVALGSIILGQPEVYIITKKDLIDESFNITDETMKKFLQGFLDKFSTFVRKQSV
ncbi:MAG: NADPH-dependent FMN reductase [Gammaproteobacteria bacterium]